MNPVVERFGHAADLLAAAGAGAFLEARPVDHNVILTLLADRASTGEPGRYWLARDAGAPIGVVFQSPLDFLGAITPMPLAAVRAVVDHMATEGIALPGVQGEAGTAAAFAGYWAERFASAARPVLGMRLSILGRLSQPDGVVGRLRQAGPSDLAQVTEWGFAFAEEVGESPPAVEAIARRVAAGHIALWEADGAPVCLVGRSDPSAGVVRIGPVFTPPEQRRRSYAAACVGQVSEAVIGDGHTCILYTDLHNPTSNGVYRRLGYDAVSEILRYELGAPDEASARP